MNYSEKMLRDDALKGKTIVVTGGGSGLGKSMATYFLELGANKDMMRKMGQKARATVETYTWEANARKVLDTYRSLVNGKNGSAYEN